MNLQDICQASINSAFRLSTSVRFYQKILAIGSFPNIVTEKQNDIHNRKSI